METLMAPQKKHLKGMRKEPLKVTKRKAHPWYLLHDDLTSNSLTKRLKLNYPKPDELLMNNSY